MTKSLQINSIKEYDKRWWESRDTLLADYTVSIVSKYIPVWCSGLDTDLRSYDPEFDPRSNRVSEKGRRVVFALQTSVA